LTSACNGFASGDAAKDQLVSILSFEQPQPDVALASPRAVDQAKRAQVGTTDPLAEQLERIIRAQTGGRIRDLHVEVRGSRVCLQGHCATFYSKQLASHAAMAAVGSRELSNDIVVE